MKEIDQDTQLPRPTDRLFFALFPDASSAERIVQCAAQIQASEHMRGKTIRPERLHVTLNFLGDFAGLPSELVSAACRAASSVVACSFAVSFGRARSFTHSSRRNPLVLLEDAPSAALRTLHGALGDALDRTGIAWDRRQPYVPHVTVLYDAHVAADQAAAPIVWMAREFRLLNSARRNPEYQVLGRWPLLD